MNTPMKIAYRRDNEEMMMPDWFRRGMLPADRKTAPRLQTAWGG
jgi:hypothetical protein